MAGKKKKPLSIRERKFIKALIEGKCPTEAMRAAGYSENTANVKQGKKLEEVRDTLEAIMERKGLTDDRLTDVLNEGLTATKVISANVIAASGEEMADAHSMTKDFIEVDDYAVRHQYLQTAHKLKGRLQQTKTEVTGPGGGPIEHKVIVEFADK